MKKIISILLALILVASVAVVSVSAGVQGNEVPNIKTAIADYEAANGTTVNTLRYYFLMPDGESGDAADRDVYEELEDHTEVLKIAKGSFVPSWYNDFTKQLGVQAAIYWWGAKDAPNPDDDAFGWVGYTMDKVEDSKNVYFADVPNVDDHVCTTIIFNNAVDGGMTASDPGYGYNGQTPNINTEGYWKDENKKNPSECENFDGMIYVLDPTALSINAYSGAAECGGCWMFYYGGDCYGNVRGGESDLEHNCLNEGPNHVHGPVQPEPDVLVGDANNDGKVTVADATRIQRYCAKICAMDGTKPYTADLTDAQLKAADANSDGKVTVADATRIQRYCAKICNMDGTKPYVAA